MTELYIAAFSGVNLPYTVLLIVVLVYWLIALVGLVDLGAYDFGVDTDFDLNADSAEVPGLSGQSMLGFLNVGEVPVMFYASIVVLSMWIISIQFHYYLGEHLAGYQSLAAVALAVPNLIFALLVAKLITTPFKYLNNCRDSETPLVGKICIVRTSEVNDKTGECEITQEGVPISIHSRTQGGEVLRKGEAGVVVKRIPETNTYIVTKQGASTGG